MRRVADRVTALFASHRFRSNCMVGFYVGILVAGVLGVVTPSSSAVNAFASADAGTEPPWLDKAAVVLWTLLYGITAPVGAVARLRAWYSAEFLALALIIAGTALHGVFLLDSGMGGIQTGVRLLAGVLALLAVLSMLRELAVTEHDGNVVVDPHLIREVVREEVAARSRGEGDAG